MARNEAFGRYERGTAPLPYVLFLVGKGTHSDFVLKCLGAKEQLSKVNDM